MFSFHFLIYEKIPQAAAGNTRLLKFDLHTGQVPLPFPCMS